MGVSGPKVQANVGISTGGISNSNSSSNSNINVGISTGGGFGVGGKVKKNKLQKKQIKADFKQKSIAAGNGCTLCQSKFTLIKRPVCFILLFKNIFLHNSFY